MAAIANTLGVATWFWKPFVSTTAAVQTLLNENCDDNSIYYQ